MKDIAAAEAQQPSNKPSHSNGEATDTAIAAGTTTTATATWPGSTAAATHS